MNIFKRYRQKHSDNTQFIISKASFMRQTVERHYEQQKLTAVTVPGSDTPVSAPPQVDLSEPRTPPQPPASPVAQPPPLQSLVPTLPELADEIRPRKSAKKIKGGHPSPVRLQTLSPSSKVNQNQGASPVYNGRKRKSLF